MHESLSVVDLENSVQIHGEGNSLEEPQRVTENLDGAKQRNMNEHQLGFLGLSGRTEMGEEGRQAWEEFQLWPGHLCSSHPNPILKS